MERLDSVGTPRDNIQHALWMSIAPSTGQISLLDAVGPFASDRHLKVRNEDTQFHRGHCRYRHQGDDFPV